LRAPTNSTAPPTLKSITDMTSVKTQGKTMTAAIITNAGMANRK
jgi:hypothetical protein